MLVELSRVVLWVAWAAVSPVGAALPPSGNLGTCYRDGWGICQINFM